MTVPIFFGWGKGGKQLGEGFVHTCDNCHSTKRFVVAEVSSKASLYFITVAKWSYQYLYVCPVCSYGFEVPTRELAQRILAAAFRDPTAVPDSLSKRLGGPLGQFLNGARAYRVRGDAYLQKGDLDEAIADYTEAIRLDPNDAGAYRNRGVAYWVKGDLDKAEKAIADWTEAIRLNPDDTIAYLCRGDAYKEKGDLDKAIADFSDALRLDPKNTAARSNRDETYARKDELDKAAEASAIAKKAAADAAATKQAEEVRKAAAEVAAAKRAEEERRAAAKRAEQEHKAAEAAAAAKRAEAVSETAAADVVSCLSEADRARPSCRSGVYVYAGTAAAFLLLAGAIVGLQRRGASVHDEMMADSPHPAPSTPHSESAEVVPAPRDMQPTTEDPSGDHAELEVMPTEGPYSIALSRGVALPVIGPDGTTMSIAMHYEVVLGEPNPEGYAWVIEPAQGDPKREEVRFSPTGNITVLIPRWRSEDGPFEAHIEDRNGKIISTRIKLRLLEPIVEGDTSTPDVPRSPTPDVPRSPTPDVPRSRPRITVGEAVDRDTAIHSDEEYYRKRAAAQKLSQ